MIFERSMIYCLFSPYSTYFRMAVPLQLLLLASFVIILITRRRPASGQQGDLRSFSLGGSWLVWSVAWVGQDSWGPILLMIEILRDVYIPKYTTALEVIWQHSTYWVMPDLCHQQYHP